MENAAAIEVTGLIKRFGALTAVNGLDLSVAVGECFGLLGPNGAGKTTTVEILEGLQQQDEGSVRLLGLNWKEHGGQLRERVGVQLQESQLYEKLSVLETVKLFGSFYQEALPASGVLDLVHLQDKQGEWVGKLSGGQRQRLAVATTLVANPDIFFFDEPTTGLDPASRRDLWEVIKSIRARGKTVLLTTHYMDEAERLCDRVAIVNQGKVIALGSPAQLIASIGGEQIIEVACQPALTQEDVGDLPGLVSARQNGVELKLTVTELHVALPALLDRAKKRNTVVLSLLTRHTTLEDVFLHLTGTALQGDAALKEAA